MKCTQYKPNFFYYPNSQNPPVMRLHLLTYALPTNPESSTRKSINLLLAAAEKRGHTLEIIHAKNCKIKFDKKAKIFVDNKIPKINILIVKPAFSGNDADVRATLIHQFELAGVPMINKYKGVVRAKNKILTLQTLTENNIPIPKTYIIRSGEHLEDAVKDIGTYPIILKTVNGLGGIGVSLIESPRSLRSIVEMLTENEYALPLIIQQYIKEARGKDIRVFVVGKKIVAAMERIATKRGEFRSNFHLGGKVRVATLSKKEIDVALRATAACGLDYAGVDIIRTNEGPKILEVNANPGLDGITQATHIDVAGAIIEYAVKKAKAKH